MAEQNASEKARQAPHQDDDRKPDELSEISKPSWKYVLGKTLREFSRDHCTDLAAALTYFAVLAIFPALIAMVSILGLFGDPQQTVNGLLDILGGFMSSDVIDAVREPIGNLAASPAAGIGLVTGLLGALWSASGFVGAFARASNRIFEVEEGRGFLQLRPVQFGVTVVAVLLLTVAAALIVLSGPVAESIGAAIGLGPQAVMIWDIAKWPVVVIIAVFVLALLYYAAPNVKQPKFKWVSVGSLVALLIWALATLGFGFYVSNFGNYDATYGSLGGVIAFLLWIWISNNALLFGVELDSELERGRQLQGGIAAEEMLQLPPRGTKKSEKMADQRAADILHGYRLRKAHEGKDYSDDDNGGDQDHNGDENGSQTAGATAVNAGKENRNAENRDSKERTMRDKGSDDTGRKGLFGRKKKQPEGIPSHGARDAWIKEKITHSDDPPVLPDGTRPIPPEHHVDPAVINKDTRFAPHRSPGERVE
ncbi:YihY/virulence factor BrkB family protein [Lysobacter korlensis]|uniref:YihY/virulence factor BrkB family protein n=1 Tax=Lysobacter korlensis TaxID=553636 RepID=A0ABV6RWS4_9GAMM